MNRVFSVSLVSHLSMPSSTSSYSVQIQVFAFWQPSTLEVSELARVVKKLQKLPSGRMDQMVTVNPSRGSSSTTRYSYLLLLMNPHVQVECLTSP